MMFNFIKRGRFLILMLLAFLLNLFYFSCGEEEDIVVDLEVLNEAAVPSVDFEDISDSYSGGPSSSGGTNPEPPPPPPPVFLTQTDLELSPSTGFESVVQVYTNTFLLGGSDVVPVETSYMTNVSIPTLVIPVSAVGKNVYPLYVRPSGGGGFVEEAGYFYSIASYPQGFSADSISIENNMLSINADGLQPGVYPMKIAVSEGVGTHVPQTLTFNILKKGKIVFPTIYDYHLFNRRGHVGTSTNTLILEVWNGYDWVLDANDDPQNTFHKAGGSAINQSANCTSAFAIFDFDVSPISDEELFYIESLEVAFHFKSIKNTDVSTTYHSVPGKTHGSVQAFDHDISSPTLRVGVYGAYQNLNLKESKGEDVGEIHGQKFWGFSPPERISRFGELMPFPLSDALGVTSIASGYSKSDISITNDISDAIQYLNSVRQDRFFLWLFGGENTHQIPLNAELYSVDNNRTYKACDLIVTF